MFKHRFRIPIWVKVLLGVVLLVGGTVAGTYTTFETKEDHAADVDATAEHIKATQDGMLHLFEYKDSLDQQRYEDIRRMLDTLYDLHLGPRAYANPADKPNK